MPPSQQLNNNRKENILKEKNKRKELARCQKMKTGWKKVHSGMNTAFDAVLSQVKNFD